jgi:formate/nitrite transporter FocA (FNT family)
LVCSSETHPQTFNRKHRKKQFAAFTEISRHFTDKGFVELLLLGVPAGFLIAALSWMLPNSEGSKFWVILFVTYVIALAGC